MADSKLGAMVREYINAEFKNISRMIDNMTLEKLYDALEEIRQKRLYKETLTIPQPLPSDIKLNLCGLRNENGERLKNQTIEINFDDFSVKLTFDMFEKALKQAFKDEEAKISPWTLPKTEGGKPGDVLCLIDGKHIFVPEEEAIGRGYVICTWGE